MRQLGDGADVLDRPAREVDMRRCDERRPIVHGPRQGVERHRHPVGALDDRHLDAAPRLGEPLVGDGGEIERRDDDLGALGIIERFGHGAHRDRDARRQRDFRGGGADDRAVACAQFAQRGPPDVVPGGGAAALPEVQEFGYFAAGALTQGTERAGVQVDALPEDRELAAITGECMRGLAARGEAACERHRR